MKEYGGEGAQMHVFFTTEEVRDVWSVMLRPI
jgi:hypothetical protein